jgi:hypothetical protein
MHSREPLEALDDLLALLILLLDFSKTKENAH